MQYTERDNQERPNSSCEKPELPQRSDELESLQGLMLNLLRGKYPTSTGVTFVHIFKIVTASGIGKDDLATVFRSIGFTAYEKGENDIAEAAFMGAIAINDKISDSNHLAYIMRRGSNFSGERIKNALELLFEGFVHKNAYSLINMALIFSITLGTDNDWKIADALIAMVKPDSSAIEWWQKLGEKGDIEGHFVHLWLLRHQIITESALGTRQFLWEKVSTAYPNVPTWLKSDVEQETKPAQYSEQDTE